MKRYYITRPLGQTDMAQRAQAELATLSSRDWLDLAAVAVVCIIWARVFRD